MLRGHLFAQEHRYHRVYRQLNNSFPSNDYNISCFIVIMLCRFNRGVVPYNGPASSIRSVVILAKRKSSGTSRGPCSREMRLQNPPRFLSSRLSCLDLDSQAQRLHTLSIYICAMSLNARMRSHIQARSHSGAIAFGRWNHP